jgi:hypothetical protein
VLAITEILQAVAQKFTGPDLQRNQLGSVRAR